MTTTGDACSTPDDVRAPVREGGVRADDPAGTGHRLEIRHRVAVGEVHGLGGRLHHLEKVLSAPVRVIRHDQRAVDGPHRRERVLQVSELVEAIPLAVARVAVVVPASDVDHQHPGVIRVDVGGEAIGDEGVQRLPREVDIESLLPRRFHVPLPAIVEPDEIARDGQVLAGQGTHRARRPSPAPRERRCGSPASGALMRIEPQVQPVAEPKPCRRSRDECPIAAPHRVERHRRDPPDSPRHMPSDAGGESKHVHRPHSNPRRRNRLRLARKQLAQLAPSRVVAGGCDGRPPRVAHHGRGAPGDADRGHAESSNLAPQTRCVAAPIGTRA